MTAIEEKPEDIIQQLRCIKKAMDGVVHRMQNELSGSQTLMTLMDKGLLDEDSKREALQRINSAYSNLINMCSSYESLSLRYDAPPVFTPVSIHRVLNIVLDENVSLINEKKLHVIVEIPDETICEVDDGKLDFIFNQLLGNCLAHTGIGIQLQIWSVNSPAFLDIHFKDSGAGISPDIKKDLFENVVSKRSETGDVQLGFGLLSSALLTRRIGGDMALLNNEAQGTHIRISIPHRRRTGYD